MVSTQTVDGVHIEISFILHTDAAGLTAMLDQARKVYHMVEGLPNVADVHYDERIGLALNKNYYPTEHTMRGVLHKLTEGTDDREKKEKT